jgi:hypothetical protein
MIRLLRKATVRIAELIAREGYDAILLSGPATPVTKRMLTYGWEKQGYGSFPPVYDLGLEGDHVLWRDFDKYPHTEERIAAVDGYIFDKHKSLMSADKALFLDDHAYWGDKMDYLASMLPRTIMPSLEFAVFVASKPLRKLPLFVGVYDDALAQYFRSIQNPGVNSDNLGLIARMERR